ncbi:hypothetical protein ACSVDA_16070 [Cytobacillus sp. Hm23]
MTNRNNNRKRQNKYPNNRNETEFANEQSIQHDSTPENNPKYGSESHKNS